MSTPADQPSMSAAEYGRLVAVGALIGIPAALLAAVFLAFVHDLEHWLWHDLPHELGLSAPPWYLVIGLPVAGACIVLAARRLLPGDGGHPPLQGIGGRAVPVSHAAGIALAAIGTLSFGAVLGPASSRRRRASSPDSRERRRSRLTTRNRAGAPSGARLLVLKHRSG